MPAIGGAAPLLNIEALPAIAGKACSYRWINKTPERIKRHAELRGYLCLEEKLLVTTLVRYIPHASRIP
jgi:hypothetical protein